MRFSYNERPFRRPRPWRLPNLLSDGSPEDDESSSAGSSLSSEEIQAEIDAAVRWAREQAIEETWTKARRELQEKIAEVEVRVRQAMEAEVAQAQRMAADAARVFEDLVEAWREASAEWLARLEDNVFALSIAVARHVLQEELCADPKKIQGVVRAALQKASVWDEPVRVRLHPDDVAVIKAIKSKDFQALLAGCKDVEWVSDDSLQRGECLVEGASKLIDGRIDVALQSLYEQIGDHD